MYALIVGRLEDPGPPTVVLAGGVGYELWIPERSLLRLPAVGEEVRLHTHLQVREDDLTLYGFESAPEREVFRALLSVNGVGPRVALSILGSPETTTLLGAVACGDARPLLAVKGIGKKTAERIVLELKDKAAAWTMAAAGAVAPGAEEGEATALEREATLVLESLGMTVDRARAAVAAAREGHQDPPAASMGVESLVRAALRHVPSSQ